MKFTKRKRVRLMNIKHTLILAMMVFGGILQGAEPARPSAVEVKVLGNKVVEWTIAHEKDAFKFKAGKGSQQNASYLGWVRGALYAGMWEFAVATGEQTGIDWIKGIGKLHGYELENSKYHADGHAVGQTWLNLYRRDRDPAMLAPTRKRFDWILSNPKTGSLEWTGYGKDMYRTDCHYRWGWCDALFMAPPVWARLAKITGEQKYLEFMDQEYHATYDLLWDTTEHLFWRDTGFFEKREKNGKKVFWARGNGWVIGGLALMIPDLPMDWEGRDFYLDLFSKLAASLKDVQRTDGTWSMGLLGSQEHYPIMEVSGTSFITYALAWGINQGILDRSTYEPVVFKAWNALSECVTDDGLLGYVQPIGAAPGEVYADKSEEYGIGAFLAAAAEVYKLVGGTVSEAKNQNVIGDRNIVKVAEAGAWTWYNDERVVFWNNYLMVGHLTVEGKSAVSAYLLPEGGHANRMQQIDISTWIEKDDHNNPAFLPLNNDSLLAVYAKHNTNNFFYSRIIRSDFQLGNEKSHDQGARVTYANLYRLSEENNRIYNFFRGRGWNPNLVISNNNGMNWSESLLIFVSGGNSTRPYVKYASNGKNRIDMFYTQGHPRKEPENNVYHIYYQEGNFYKSNGKKIRSLEEVKIKPLLPSEGTLIYDGSGPGGRGWVHDLERGKSGESNKMAGVYISSPDGDEGLDLRYRYARFNPRSKKWRDQEIAYAGTRLYLSENHYAGGICIDPENLNVVYLSSDVDPVTGKPNGTGKYQIYKGVTNDGGKSWQFEQLTFDLQNDNLRPVVPRNKPANVNECILWFRGEYNSYKDFDTEIVGFVN